MDRLHCNCCIASSISTSVILGDLAQQQKKNSLGTYTVSIPRTHHINSMVPASAAAVTPQSAAVVHDPHSPQWDVGRNLSVQTQHPLPPPLALHHPPSAQTECQILGGFQDARSEMQEIGHSNTLLLITSQHPLYRIRNSGATPTRI